MQNSAHSTIASTTWDADFADRSPIFEPLRAVAARLRGPHWPTLDKLQWLASEPPTLETLSGMPLSIVREDRSWSLGFEARAYLHGELQVRTTNWHDLFNVLAWRVFPRAKAAINRAHYEALPEARDGRRGARRDALTLFDESGVIVAASDPALLDAVREFRWRELFVERRAELADQLRCVVFGHALYEKALAPYVGLTGHAVLLEVSADTIALDAASLVERLDAELATRLDDAAAFTAAGFAPFPLLGMPGWWPDNADAAFYDNERYFRPGRTRSAS